MPSIAVRQRNRNHKPALAWLAWFTVAWTLLLLFMGGFTTSIGAGMVFLDWPLSDGSLNPQGWLSDQDMFAEHSHRLLGAQVGLLVMAIGIWIFLKEERTWLRRLALFAFLLVTVQGLLGGGRVLFDELNIESDHNLLAQTLAIIHACAAQIFLCVMVAISVGLTRFWIERDAGLSRPMPRELKLWGLASCAAIFLQLIAGAVMRHHHAGLAIPYFPLSSPDSLLPAAWGFHVGIHFAHRVGAVAVTVVLLAFVWQLWRRPEALPVQRVLAASLVLLLTTQIYLGASIIWSVRNPYPTTLHVIVGALILATAWAITFTCFRRTEPVAERARNGIERQTEPSGAVIGG